IQDPVSGRLIDRAQFGPVPYEVMHTGPKALLAMRPSAFATVDIARGGQVTGGLLPESWQCRRLMFGSIKAEGQFLGTTTIASKLLGKYSAGDEATLLAVGRLLGAAVVHSQVYQRVRRA